MKPFRYVQSFVDKKNRCCLSLFPPPRLQARPPARTARIARIPGGISRRARPAQPCANRHRQEQAGKRCRATVAAYFLSQQFAEFAPSTQAALRSTLQRFRDKHGELPLGSMPPKFINLMLGNLKPGVARNWFKHIRALCQFAVSVEMIESDPTQGIKRPKAKTERRRAWTDAEVAQYEAAHPIGSKARLGFALGLYTVQRLGDVIRMGRQHIQNGTLSVRQNKTGTPLSLPVRQELQAIIDATPSEHLTFLVKDSGKPFGPTEYSGQFRAWCDEAGLPKGCTFHGLRATGCTRLADDGCSTREIAAWSGHKTLKEIERYTESANQKRLAVQALARGNV